MAAVLDARHDLLPDVAALVVAHQPLEPRLGQDDRLVDIVTVPGHPGLHPEHVEGVRADRTRARVHQRAPQRGAVKRHRPAPKARAARLAPVDHAHGRPGDGHLDVLVRGQLERPPGERGEQRRRLRPLDGQHDEALVGRLEVGLLRDEEVVQPLERLLRQPRRQLDEEPIVGHVDVEQGEHLAVGLEEGGSGSLPGPQALDLVRQHGVQERLPVAAGDRHLAHERPVDHSHPLPHRAVLGDGASVVAREDPAPDLLHRRAVSAVHLVQRQSVRHGFIVDGELSPVNLRHPPPSSTMAAVASPFVPPAGARRRFHRRLLAWYAVHRRDLPWRETDDPYHILVSEIMLQQTQVERVIPKYHEFLARYPTFESLARARPAEVKRVWYPLGYNIRPLQLQGIARETLARYDGRLPDDTRALRRMPGIGRYTAGAILSFAYRRPAALVDTNVRRVLGRVFLGRRRLARLRGQKTM